jgi:hypothetical protein
VALLLLAFGAAQDIASAVVRTGFALVTSKDFWIGQLSMANLYATTFALAYFAAAGMITFATENRSTPLRILMMAQQASFVGWVAYEWIAYHRPAEFLLNGLVVASGYWFMMGTMLGGERSEMSHRVKRRLPQSALGRMFLTWLNPGPSSGYMFAVANLTSICVLCLAAGAVSDWSRSGGPGRFQFVSLVVLVWSYVAAYLGLGRLVVTVLRRFTVVTMFAGVLLHSLILLAGSGIPTSVQWMSLALQNEPYSYLQITNPFWTLSYIDGNSSVPEIDVLMSVIPAAAVCVLFLNLPGLVREMRQVRTPLPERVAEDEAELHPPPEKPTQSPWDQPADR